MEDVAIIGTGFIGRAWAISHARAGNSVRLWDQDADATGRAKDYIAGLLPDLLAHDLLNGQAPEEVLTRIQPVESLEAAVAGVGYVQENTFERLDVKIAIFQRLDSATPADAVIASSTSALLPSAFTEGLAGRARCLVAHPINPPYVIPAAEVVPAPWTSPATVERAARILTAIGQKPIVMKREIDGFVMNRLQGAILEEAFRLVADGYASVEDVDIGIRDGLALRWSFMGPFETIDLNAPGGVRDYVERYQGLYRGLFASMMRRVEWDGPVIEEIARDRRAALPADQLQPRQEWRDRRLMALIAHKNRADRDIGA
ncbi:3-hydroxyacyl-CoA dehydrogenase [Ancylobacter amanitiformis]|uniref:3-hydroxyacyl-CoA dehydrogenase n=1 Tax=Ancylobacter amanitiformis TaxID=217069 RepID=A0ABU0LKX2_9HYPH|nr:3-hydroxyacyl-CoA dehydrogenase [Ancylobacter amanitiformis]MDQ0509348.1 3-hydroxyacyl-CoA dehydrogenase [Ancylobacter amanitiformis]